MNEAFPTKRLPLIGVCILSGSFEPIPSILGVFLLKKTQRRERKKKRNGASPIHFNMKGFYSKLSFSLFLNRFKTPMKK
jgi:hypothetical protein